MTRRRGATIRADHKGFTLVELLIAVTILAIVIVAVCGFILVGVRSYASANSDITVQQEAQLVLNQMSDILIDTTGNVNYAGYDASGNAVLVLKDSEFTFEPEAKSLIMYNGVPVEKTASDGSTTAEIEKENGGRHYHFHWDKNDETLYYAEVDVKAADMTSGDVGFPPFGADGWVVLAEHVNKFKVDLTQVEEKRVVKLELTFVNGQREYHTSNNVTIRNKVGVNDAEIGSLEKSQTLSVIPGEKSVILEPGETYQFSTPKVVGRNVADKSVTWSIVKEGSTEDKIRSDFMDSANGILQIAPDEKTASFKVQIEANARDRDGNLIQVLPLPTVTVHIKRVHTVALSIQDSSDTTVPAGSTVTVAASVEGNKLGVTCDKCGDPTAKDKNVADAGAYEWEVVEGSGYAAIENGGAKTADLKIASNAAEGGTVRIRATSYLSAVKSYDAAVQGELVLTIKSEEAAIPMTGELKYGDEEAAHNYIKNNVSPVEWKYITCIRVIDNSTVDPQPPKILLHFTKGGDFVVTPDLFDLDLNRSYTFYVQALDAVTIANHDKNVHYRTESRQDIWTEYINHVDDKAPYGYDGDVYNHGPVYYGILEKPKAIWNHNGIAYKEKELTLDPVNVYTVGEGFDMIGTGNIEPDGFENIWLTGSMLNRMTYSVYVGEGNDRSGWTPLYWFDGESMSYKGSKSVGGGVGTLDIRDYGSKPGNPFFKMGQGDRTKLCGTYHIVPGFCYDNRSSRINAYDIIGWQGFTCDGQDTFTLPRELRYYEFDNSTIHIEVNSAMTMDIDDDWYKGQALFPLPHEMARSVLFLRLHSGEWQTTGAGLSVQALLEGDSNPGSLDFTYVRYRYIPISGNYEVEPFKMAYHSWENKIYTHSYGTHVCKEGGKKWELRDPGYTDIKDLICNVENLSYHGSLYQTYFPLPTDSNFPFSDMQGQTEGQYELYLLTDTAETAPQLIECYVVYEPVGGKHKITIADRWRHERVYGVFECADDGTSWTRLQ